MMDEKKKCSACYGSGKISHWAKKGAKPKISLCPACKGSGQAPAKPEERQKP